MRECTNCGTIYNKTSKTVTLCPSCNCERVKGRDHNKKILARAKNRAIKNNLPFDIDLSDIVVPEVCPMLKIPLQSHTGASGGRPNSPSLDRIDPSKGYIKGNVRVISHLANCMKSSATPEQLVLFANWVLSENTSENSS